MSTTTNAPAPLTETVATAAPADGWVVYVTLYSPQLAVIGATLTLPTASARFT
jgi:hypothetical protein